ncbi:ABC transporter substrate-binding protein [Corynebacterium anserum]|uniref:Uncharacterized protein n=1 Tax=Corynebacterium anserum TaxID=2684406 RepID=A0A7G7YPA8_9CORY|nr:ABC transporter substrate-binding protein [Corynebacterium anserum]MBC2681936.1 hypothetical protein [Corynebacterium anserum]QNH96328.1 hypothetical protein GP473_06310 [Corynebacterium anserum]
MTRRLGAGVSASVIAAALVACQANPGDAPTVEEDTAETTGTTLPTAPPTADQLRVNVSVDSFSGNLNPHLVGNMNPVISAIADLTLPSAFVPSGDDWTMNSQLLSEVIPDNPESPNTVVYRLNPAAQWSDGTPLSISDFQYLAERIVHEPGAREVASYGQIKSITTERGGAIKVTFRKPFAGWKELFRHLLPSHIYRSEARPFATMMDGSLAASGGVFNVTSVDADRGRVELRRNDRYWGETPAATDKLIFEVVPDLVASTQMMRTGQLQMMMSRPTAISDTALGQLPEVSHRTVERQVDLGLALNTRSKAMSSLKQRQRVVEALNTRAIAKVVTGLPDAVAPTEPSLVADATTDGVGVSSNQQDENKPAAARNVDPANNAGADTASSDAASADTVSPGDTNVNGAQDGKSAENTAESTSMTAAQDGEAKDSQKGSQRNTPRSGKKTGDEGGASRFLGDVDLKAPLIVAVPTDDTPSLSAARMIVDQLNEAGIAAKTVVKDPTELFSVDIPSGDVDAVVSWYKTPRSIGDYLNQFHCVANKESMREESQQPSGLTTDTAAASTTASTSTTTPVTQQDSDEAPESSTTSRGTGDNKSSDQSTQRPNSSGNITGLCDTQLSALMARMASGTESFQQAREEINALVAQANVLVPLVRDRQIVAVGPSLEGPSGPLGQWKTDPVSGIMATAPRWKKKESLSAEPMEESH